jgi:hypothetical protein
MIRVDVAVLAHRQRARQDAGVGHRHDGDAGGAGEQRADVIKLDPWQLEAGQTRGQLTDQ